MSRNNKDLRVIGLSFILILIILFGYIIVNLNDKRINENKYCEKKILENGFEDRIMSVMYISGYKYCEINYYEITQNKSIGNLSLVSEQDKIYKLYLDKSEQEYLDSDDFYEIIFYMMIILLIIFVLNFINYVASFWGLDVK